MADFICGRVASFHLIFVQNYLTADSATLIFVDVLPAAAYGDVQGDRAE